MKRFRRAAIATDKQWVKAATQITNKLFPQIEARVFTTSKKDEALEWVSNLPETPHAGKLEAS